MVELSCHSRDNLFGGIWSNFCLYKNNLIKSKDTPLKVLSKGELKKSLEISANFFSKSALTKIEKAGGKAIFV